MAQTCKYRLGSHLGKLHHAKTHEISAQNPQAPSIWASPCLCRRATDLSRQARKPHRLRTVRSHRKRMARPWPNQHYSSDRFYAAGQLCAAYPSKTRSFSLSMWRFFLRLSSAVGVRLKRMIKRSGWREIAVFECDATYCLRSRSGTELTVSSSFDKMQ